jgi:hypothetical protein
MLIRRAAPILLAIPTAVLAAACAAAPPPLSPPGEGPPPPSLWGDKGANELDKEMLALARAEDEIDKVFPHAGKERAGLKGRDGMKAEEPKAAADAPDPCAVACKALASMTKSADHLCALAGEGDGRCEDARGRVRGAATRVRSVCPGCAAAAGK